MLVNQDSETRLLTARIAMERNGVIPPGLLRPVIAESWRRCAAAGLNPRRPPKPDLVPAAELERYREEYAMIRRLALTEMQALQHQLGAGAFVLAFAAPDGVLLETLMADAHRGEIEGFGVIPGSFWCESRLGTNAVGTAIMSRSRIEVCGGEHFFADYNRLNCMTAPIFAPDRSLAGMLDASGPAASHIPHARATLALAAAQIEAQLFRATHGKNRVLALHGRAEFLDTAYAGLLALDESDRILAANEPARFMLAGLPEPAGSPLAALFAPGSPLFSAGAAGSVNDRTGRLFHARLDGGPELAQARFVPRRKAPRAPEAVADDPAVRTALDLARRAAQRGLPVLIRGETGTGKEMAARAAHVASGRTGKFVAVNCAAIPAELLAAELFGHVEGAFTGAKRGGARGLALEADNGTLFLDEIADLPHGLQAALLRFLDDFSVRPVGGATQHSVDVLLLTATNADLQQAVAAGKFRADLYYRLAITEIVLPRLAQRTDLALLARTLLATILPGANLTDAACQRLAAHDWPGNIRELRNLLTKLSLSGHLCYDTGSVAVLLPRQEEVLHSGSVLRDVQSREIAAALRDAKGNVSAAARSLGVSRNRIYRALADHS